MSQYAESNVKQFYIFSHTPPLNYVYKYLSDYAEHVIEFSTTLIKKTAYTVVLHSTYIDCGNHTNVYNCTQRIKTSSLLSTFRAVGGGQHTYNSYSHQVGIWTTFLFLCWHLYIALAALAPEITLIGVLIRAIHTFPYRRVLTNVDAALGVGPTLAYCAGPAKTIC